MNIKLNVSVPQQTLDVIHGSRCLKTYRIGTAKNGVGEIKNSFCTPRGEHIIRAKIGGMAPMNTVFIGRRPTGEIYTPLLSERFPGRDWILTRILWLSGCEVGRNRLGAVDTMQRYIYIHGCPDSATLGQPSSHGCVRMHNSDICELFELVSVGTSVYISEID